MQVLTIGDILVDYQYWVEEMPQPGDEQTIVAASQGAGGSAANAALALCSLGVRTGFVGRVGADQTAARLVGQLKTAGLDLSLLQYGDQTGYTVTFIDRRGERTMFADRGASAQPPEFTTQLATALTKIQLLFLTGYYLVNPEQAEFSLRAAQLVRGAGGLVALDPSPNIGLVDKSVLGRIFDLTDLLLPNERELQTITGISNCRQALAQLEDLPLVAVKRGSKGAILAWNDGERKVIEAPALPVNPIDTTGAGDSFNAGFIAAYLRGDPPLSWLENGNALAAKVITQKGAVSLFL